MDWRNINWDRVGEFMWNVMALFGVASMSVWVYSWF